MEGHAKKMRSPTLATVFGLSLAGLAAACGPAGPTTGPGAGGSGSGPVAGGGSDDVASGSGSALRTVVSQMKLPRTGLDHAMDVDGDGVRDNQFGRMLSVLRSTVEIDLQPALDKMLREGRLVMLQELRRPSNGELQFVQHAGQVAGRSTADSFSGKGEFIVQKAPFRSDLLDARLTGERLRAGPGRTLVAMTFSSGVRAFVPLVQARIEGRINEDGFEGVIAGAIPVADAKKSLVPALAYYLDGMYKSSANPLHATLLRKFIDADKNGTITAAEVAKSAVLGLVLLAADIDSDNDGKRDAISFGLKVQAVPCRFH